MPSISNSTKEYQEHIASVLFRSLMVTGLAFVSLFFATQQTPAMPLGLAGDAPSQTTQSSRLPASSETLLPYSVPVSVTIPAIHVESSIITLGKNADGTVAVPGAADYDKAAWYKHSPTPGQSGASIIEGHLDFDGKGPAVFYELGKLQPGDSISVLRRDSTTATFTVDTISVYAKDNFPVEKVYTTTAGSAELRLITCGGAFNSQSGQYDSNIVVSASLADVSS